MSSFDGEILKTSVAGKWHFYNRIGGVRHDLTVDQFHMPPIILISSPVVKMAFTDTNQVQYDYLSNRFNRAIESGTTAA
ncbi:MAG: hypothetical protein H7Z16_07695 [Pyrinomonadaceae bacterium]|nr:hypothetical protein [Pyrinomonadaceae bacterium]